MGSYPTNCVYIMRGIPGSGKSTRAKEIAKQDYICSADDYFIKNGVYTFVQHEIGKAHSECLKKFVGLLHNHRNDICDDVAVVVDNTNLRKWEYETYVKIAEIAGWDVAFEEFVPPRDYTLGDYVRLCASRNAHGVSANQCMRMASIFEVRQ